jgi:hypothetical protein
MMDELDLGFEVPATDVNIPTGDDLIAMMVTSAVVLLVVAVVISGLVALISGFIARHAQRRGRSFEYFYWASFGMGALVPSLIVATISPMTLTSLRVSCASCAEQVSSLATKCPLCHQQLSPVKEAGLAAARAFMKTTADVRKYSTLLAIVAATLWVVGVALHFVTETIGFAPVVVAISIPLAVLATGGLVSLRARKKAFMELKSLAGV